MKFEARTRAETAEHPPAVPPARLECAIRSGVQESRGKRESVGGLLTPDWDGRPDGSERYGTHPQERPPIQTPARPTEGSRGHVWSETRGAGMKTLELPRTFRFVLTLRSDPPPTFACGHAPAAAARPIDEFEKQKQTTPRSWESGELAKRPSVFDVPRPSITAVLRSGAAGTVAGVQLT